MARSLILNYRPLVEMMVVDRTGQLVGRHNQNHLVRDFKQTLPPGEPVTKFFLKFLKDSAK